MISSYKKLYVSNTNKAIEGGYNGYSSWYLRSSIKIGIKSFYDDKKSHYASSAWSRGAVYANVVTTKCGIRLAIWINISK